MTATPDQAQQMHRSIRQQLAGSNERIADRCRILYGGSMKPNNAKTLISQPDVDGGLIIRVNAQWRVCFVWTDEGPSDVEIVDHH